MSGRPTRRCPHTRRTVRSRAAYGLPESVGDSGGSSPEGGGPVSTAGMQAEATAGQPAQAAQADEAEAWRILMTRSAPDTRSRSAAGDQSASIKGRVSQVGSDCEWPSPPKTTTTAASWTRAIPTSPTAAPAKESAARNRHNSAGTRTAITASRPPSKQQTASGRGPASCLRHYSRAIPATQEGPDRGAGVRGEIASIAERRSSQGAPSRGR